MSIKRLRFVLALLLVLVWGAGGVLAGQTGQLTITSFAITCSSATITYEATASNGSDFAIVTVENLTTNQVLATDENGSPFGATVTLTFPPQPVGSVLMITVETFMVVSTEPEGCTGDSGSNGGDPIPPRCADGRLNYYDCEPLAIYPVMDEGSYGVQVWIVEAEQQGAGRFGFFVSSQDLDALPDNPEEPILVAESDDGFARFYKLPSGELQFVGGPDYEGKYFVFRFENFPNQYPEVSTYKLTDLE